MYKRYINFLYFLSRNSGPTAKFKQLNNLVLSVLITGVLMWSYTLNVICTLPNHQGLHIMAIVYSIVHILSPLIFRFYPSITFCTNLFIFAGFSFQLHYSLVTGGFFTTTPIWFSILPLIAGIVTSKSNILFWIVITVLGLVALYLLDIYGYVVNLETPSSRIWAQINISIGYIMLNSLLILAYITYRDRDQKQLIEKSESIKQLLRIISHDILNPLTSIKISTEYYLRKESLSKETTTDLLNKTLNSLNDIKDIIDNTRQIEAIELGKVILKDEEVSVMTSLNKTIESFKFSLIEKNITIDTTYPERDIFIKGDRSALQNNVFCNLISNAIKFSPEYSTIKIAVTVENDSVGISFINSGQTIALDKLPYLFSHYHPTSKLGTKGEKGTGFGLPIAKNIVDKLGGQITVSILNNQETQFLLRFPLSQ
jgi:signal transduction histidine kinase